MQRTDLQIIVVLAEERNMRKAAERLFVSQPALSQRLQTIEDSWGTTLFIRSKRGLEITPEGEKIAAFAKRFLDEENRLKEEIYSNEGEIFGTLKLAVTSIVGQYWLPNMLKIFVSRYPQVKISLTTGWSSEILHHMYDHDTHVGILRGEIKWKGPKIHLFEDVLHLVDTEISSFSELEHCQRPFIQFKSDSSYYQEIQDWWYNHFKKPPERTIVVDQIDTCKQMAMNGIGYAILPSISLTEKDKGIYKIPLSDKTGKAIKRDTWLITHEDVLNLRQVKAFIDLVKHNP
ncbi:LysR family transcriptional regulator [Tuberibacillus calidus]|jgi:DNA-binding transcriptional LysR family regulator|uniref:LysR family transcriptional regulator n=1 Tax=Tuberibacillus calidus TaxID=340097 RepID=UPI00041E802C|nr:LysR family transcriptional regulator [Tuberibacillus calidus]